MAVDTNEPLKVFFWRSEEANDKIADNLELDEEARKRFKKMMARIAVGFKVNKKTGAVYFLGAEDRDLEHKATIGGKSGQFI